ncbi:MAG: DUF6473 family protein [Pseudomonadota bacterium]
MNAIEIFAAEDQAIQPEASMLFTADQPLFDYETHTFGRMHQIFRGPMPDLTRPYIAYLGSSATFGRFTDRPFATLTAEALGLTAVNFGTEGAGPGYFLEDADILPVANGARACVIELMGARALSNRMYTVRPRRNERMARPAQLLRGLYPEVDFRQFAKVANMLTYLKALDAARFRLVENEIRSAWSARMAALLAALEVPTILLWISPRSPAERPGRGDVTWRYPHFVDDELLASSTPGAAGLVECIGEQGLPQDLTKDGQPVLFRPTGEPILANERLPSPALHARAAELLTPLLADLIA